MSEVFPSLYLAPGNGYINSSLVLPSTGRQRCVHTKDLPYYHHFNGGAYAIHRYSKSSCLEPHLVGNVFLLIGTTPTHAQINRESLALELEEAYQRRLIGVNRLVITSTMEEGMFQGLESTIILEKVEMDGLLHFDK